MYISARTNKDGLFIICVLCSVVIFPLKMRFFPFEKQKQPTYGAHRNALLQSFLSECDIHSNCHQLLRYGKAQVLREIIYKLLKKVAFTDKSQSECIHSKISTKQYNLFKLHWMHAHQDDFRHKSLFEISTLLHFLCILILINCTFWVGTSQA